MNVFISYQDFKYFMKDTVCCTAELAQPLLVGLMYSKRCLLCYYSKYSHNYMWLIIYEFATTDRYISEAFYKLKPYQSKGTILISGGS